MELSMVQVPKRVLEEGRMDLVCEGRLETSDHMVGKVFLYDYAICIHVWCVYHICIYYNIIDIVIVCTTVSVTVFVQHFFLYWVDDPKLLMTELCSIYFIVCLKLSALRSLRFFIILLQTWPLPIWPTICNRHITDFSRVLSDGPDFTGLV